MKSFVQSTSNKFKVIQQLGSTTLVTKPMLPLDSTALLKAETPIVYLFEQINAAPIGAYSLRALNRNYTGPAVRIRRSSDNTELNVGFLKGNFDVETAKSFVGGGNGFITTWYDQSGNARDLTQGTQASQPRIVLTGDSDTNNRPYIYIGEAAGRKLTNTAFVINGLTAGILNAVCAPVGSQTAGTNNIDHCMLYWAENSSWGGVGISPLAGMIAWRYGTGQSGNSQNVTRSSTSNVLASFLVIKRTTTEFALANGIQVGAAQTGKTTPTANNASTLQVGGGDSAGTMDGKACELLIFNSAPSGIEDALTQSQKSFYGIL
jgi:hypothetical protein